MHFLDRCTYVRSSKSMLWAPALIIKFASSFAAWLLTVLFIRVVRTAWGLPDDDDGSSVIEKIIISLSFLAAELLLSFRTSSHSNGTTSTTILQLHRNSSEGVTKFASTALQSKTITRAINILLSLQSGRLPLGAEHYCEPKMGQFWPLALAHTTKGRTIGHSLLGL